MAPIAEERSTGKGVKSMKIKVVKVERLKLTCPPSWSDVIVRGCES